MVIVAQLVRALDCGSKGRGFETPHSPFKFETLQSNLRGFFMHGVEPELIVLLKNITFRLLLHSG